MEILRDIIEILRNHKRNHGNPKRHHRNLKRKRRNLEPNASMHAGILEQPNFERRGWTNKYVNRANPATYHTRVVVI
jgi:hypothetical protein